MHRPGRACDSQNGSRDESSAASTGRGGATAAAEATATPTNAQQVLALINAHEAGGPGKSAAAKIWRKFAVRVEEALGARGCAAFADIGRKVARASGLA